MQILLISGFLGAGKTTFIQAMAKATGRSFVIVENEFSDLGIDGPILRENAAALEIRELSEGCICCSAKLDFASTVLTVANTINPDYLLVEPSGVAFPGKILRNLKPILYERISLLAPVTLIDAQNYAESRRRYPRYFEDQLKSARIVVLSKSEQLSPEEFEAIRSGLKIPDQVRFPSCHYSRWTEEEWLSLLQEEELPEKPKVPGAGRFTLRKRSETGENPAEALENMSLNPFLLRSPDQLLFFLEELVSGRFGRVVRAKGFIGRGSDAARFDLVEGTYIIGGFNTEEPGAVIVGSGLKREAILRFYKELL